MCGIAGLISYDRAPEPEVLLGMRNTLLHRGPDQQGLYVDEHAGFAHTRLSVVDLEHGRQPMYLRHGDEEYLLVYNGELYNTEELRAELLAVGYHFEGHSDTEVLLAAYSHWQGACLDRLNGIFAFAVWEKHRKRLFLARDRIGVKPLYFTIRENSLIFASELKAILSVPGVTANLGADGIAELALLSPGRTPGKAILRGMEEIKPAECAYFSREYGWQRRIYWKLHAAEHHENAEETAGHVRDLLKDAIERQLVSDVPVGTLLSGGLDSSIISSVADIYFTARGKRLKTFSVTYKDQAKYFKKTKFQPNGDDEYIARMNRYLGAEHFDVVLDTADLAQALSAAMEARDLPGMADVDSSLLLFCRQIKDEVTVALSGECADEIFGGYPWYRDETIRSRAGLPWAQSTDYRFGFLRPEWREKIDPQAVVMSQYEAVLRDADTSPEAMPEQKRIQEMVRLNCDLFMQTLLSRKDAMSMACALEVRVPFCDYRLAVYLYNVPWEIKEFGGREKGLLRAAMADFLPREVLYRKKSPYPKTHNPAYLGAVRGLLRNILEDANAPLCALFDRAQLETLLRDEGRAQPWYGQLMTTPQTIAWFVQVNYWLKKYRVQVSL
ncbi:MAG: asparagine synthase (glutamine-hydrolyzing) [Oscillospiraceae bacterium]|jgi:asparagine synthase (glutamine-hydrolysing)|nr:asparagine synthase (glutamine-hydrolyzing) [Oscillospiraceae bacterium]